MDKHVVVPRHSVWFRHTLDTSQFLHHQTTFQASRFSYVGLWKMALQRARQYGLDLHVVVHERLSSCEEISNRSNGEGSRWEPEKICTVTFPYHKHAHVADEIDVNLHDDKFSGADQTTPDLSSALWPARLLQLFRKTGNGRYFNTINLTTERADFNFALPFTNAKSVKLVSALNITTLECGGECGEVLCRELIVGSKSLPSLCHLGLLRGNVRRLHFEDGALDTVEKLPSVMLKGSLGTVNFSHLRIHSARKVTELPDEFAKNTQNVTLSNMSSLRSIGSSFGLKSRLLELDLTSCTSLMRIEDDFCESCSRLKKVVLPSSLTYIGCGCFFECTSLLSIDFSQCSALQSVGAASDDAGRRLQMMSFRNAGVLEPNFSVLFPPLHVDSSSPSGHRPLHVFIGERVWRRYKTHQTSIKWHREGVQLDALRNGMSNELEKMFGGYSLE